MLAGVLVTNVLSGRPILASIDNFDVYSEFSFADGALYLEANYFFRELYHAYPDAYFLLNTRDTDRWIESRNRHFGRNAKGRGSLAERIQGAYRATPVETEQIWRDYHAPFHQEVRTFFASYPDARFLEFPIETGSAEQIVDWVKADYDLDPALWAAANVTVEREQSRKRRRNPFTRVFDKLRKNRR